MNVMKFDRYSALILGLFLVMLGVRVVHMTADPPAELSWSGGLFFDEGALAHNARNQVLFGQWQTDEWNDFYYSPILAYIKWLVFATLGVGMWQLRLVSLLFTAGTLAVAYQGLKISHGRLTAALGLGLLGGNYVYLMYSRLGLTEISVVFLATLTLYCWLLGMTARTAWQRGLWMALAGSSCFLAFIFKTLLAYFLPVPFAALAVLWIFPRTPSDRKRLFSMAVWCLLGMAITAGVWWQWFYLPNYESIHQAGDYVKMLSLPNSPQELVRNVSRTPFFDIFLQTPVHLIVSLGYFIYLLYVLLHERAKLAPIDVFAGFWFLAHLAFFLGYSYRPTRYYVPIIPAMSILTARALGGLLRYSARREFTRLSIWFWVGTWLLTSVIGGYAVLPLLKLPSLSGRMMLFAGTLAALIGVLGAMVWNRRRIVAIPPILIQGIGTVLLIGFLSINGWQYVKWARHPQFTVRDISRELGRMLDNAFLAGLPTPMLCMENTHRALYVWENFANDRETFRKYPITHLFLAEFNDEVGYYKRTFPEIMRRARLLKTYWIKGSRFHLFSIVEPTLENLQVMQKPGITPATLELEVDVVNNDPRVAKTLGAGFLLFPAENGPAPVLQAQEQVTLEPLAQTRLTFSRAVTPGAYDMLAAIFPEQRDVYEVEQLSAQGGRVTTDTQASGGAVRVAPADFAGFLAYGPYRQYPPGQYVVEFSLKSQGPPADAERPIVTLDVSTDTGQTVVAHTDILPADITTEGQYQTFRLTFALKTRQILEFRIIAHAQTEVWADMVQVNFFQGVWRDQVQVTAIAPEF